MNLFRIYWILITFFGIILLDARNSLSEPQCNISEEKKYLIEGILCGGAAVESNYHFTGPNCVRQSVEKRFEDSAVQIYLLRLCGYPKLSDDVRKANQMAMAFIETLSICVSQEVDLDGIMEDRMRYVERRAVGERLRCIGSIRSMIQQRIPYFESMVRQITETDLAGQVMEKLQLSADASGNITEK